ncbi:MAG: hypothetical protein ABJ327_16905 [Litoreibacter sp.]
MIDEITLDIRQVNKFVRAARDRAGRCQAIVNGKRCGAPASENHAIQKNNSLKKIWEENKVDHIYTDLFPKGDNESVRFKSIAARKASTFYGFCSKHDQQLFSPIEQPDSSYSDEAISLMFYRALASEIYGIKSAHKLISLVRDEGRAGVKKAYASQLSSEFQNEIKYCFRDYRVCGEIIEDEIFAGAASKLKVAAIRLEKPLPFCFQSLRSPIFDFTGALILPKTGEIWDKTLLFGGYIGQFYYIIVASTHTNLDHGIDQFLQSFRNISKEQIGRCALFLALRYSSGCAFFSPAFINKMSELSKRNLIKYARFEVGGGLPREPHNMFSYAPQFNFTTDFEIVR